MKKIEICDLLEQKANIFDRFLVSTQSLRDASDFQKEREGIEQLIKDRRRYIDAIKGIDSQVETLQRDCPDLVSPLPYEARQRVSKLFKSIGDVAEKAQHISREYEEKLAILREEIKAQIVSTRHSQAGIGRSRADRAYSLGKAKFLDIKL